MDSYLCLENPKSVQQSGISDMLFQIWYFINIENYAVTTDKASGIVNDPNTYAGGKYIFDLLLSIISVSLKTQELIAQLPEYKEIWISLYTKRAV